MSRFDWEHRNDPATRREQYELGRAIAAMTDAEITDALDGIGRRHANDPDLAAYERRLLLIEQSGRLPQPRTDEPAWGQRFSDDFDTMIAKAAIERER